MTETEIKALIEENEKLRRQIIGLKTHIKNLEEKLYKRNESYKGEVTDGVTRKKH